MTANKMNVPFKPMRDDEYGTTVSNALFEKHRRLFDECLAVIDSYAKERDGNTLLLLDGAWLGLAQRCRDHLTKLGVEVQATPPSLGELLSKQAQ